MAEAPSDRRQGTTDVSVPDADRRQALVRIAYRHLAERGFEGLRVRAVAAEVGINHATLLHYFPTKEALIQEVVGVLVQEFSTAIIAVAPAPDAAAPAPLEDLRYEFTDLRSRLHATPEMFVVLGELAVRARRDPAIAAILHGMELGWRGHLARILARGVATGAFRPDLPVEDTALALVAQFAAIGYRTLEPASATDLDRLIAQMARQVEHWLTVAGGASERGLPAR